MDCVALYEPMVRQLAHKYATSPEHTDDLLQEGLIKLHCVSKKYEDTDFSTVDWRKRFYVIAKNAIIDYLRVQSKFENRRLREDASAVQALVDKIPCERGQQAFEDLVLQNAFKELSRLLSNRDSRVLQELLYPSEDFQWFVRQKEMVYYVMGKHMKFREPKSQDPLCDYTVGQYLDMDTREFKSSVDRIRSTAVQCGLFKQAEGVNDGI